MSEKVDQRFTSGNGLSLKTIETANHAALYLAAGKIIINSTENI